MVYGGGELNDFEAVMASLRGLITARSGLGREELHQIGIHYLQRVRKIAPMAERITNKMPGNFRYVGLIRLAFPNARIIHIRRDPLDTCLSCFSILFMHDYQRFSYDLAELGRYYRAYTALMEHWREVLPLEHILVPRISQDQTACMDGKRDPSTPTNLSQLDWTLEGI
jgi:hypothetical protein